jgi:hypothetical protein
MRYFHNYGFLNAELGVLPAFLPLMALHPLPESLMLLLLLLLLVLAA